LIALTIGSYCPSSSNRYAPLTPGRIIALAPATPPSKEQERVRRPAAGRGAGSLERDETEHDERTRGEPAPGGRRERGASS
jgi:hypothetical protein